MHDLIFDVTSAASRAALDYNDDGFGYTPHRLWVLDGATGVAKRQFTRGASDASWLAQLASAILAQQDKVTPLADLLPQLEAEISRSFALELTISGAEEVLDIEMPTACLGLVQIASDALELVCIGDISIIVAIPGRDLRVITDDSLKPFSDRTMAAWREICAATADPTVRWEMVRPVILENRAFVNRPDGYRVIHPTRPWSGIVPIERLPLVPGTQIFMASDGLWRLVDLFDETTPATLLRDVAEAGIEESLAEVRLRERDDAENQRFPRIKTSDDATGLLACLRRL